MAPQLGDMSLVVGNLGDHLEAEVAAIPGRDMKQEAQDEHIGVRR